MVFNHGRLLASGTMGLVKSFTHQIHRPAIIVVLYKRSGFDVSVLGYRTWPRSA